MKGICLTGVLLAFSVATYAQRPVEGDNNAPILFSDVVKQYEQAHNMNRVVNEENGKVIEGES